MIHTFLDLFRDNRLTALDARLDARLDALDARVLAASSDLADLGRTLAAVETAAFDAQHDVEVIDRWADDVDVEIAALRGATARAVRAHPAARLARLGDRLVAAARKFRSTLI